MDILNHCEVTYFATNTPIEMKYTDWKPFVLIMLFLIQAHNEFLSLMGSETFTKILPLYLKSAKKTLGLWINEQSNVKIIQFETEGQVASAESILNEKRTNTVWLVENHRRNCQ